MQLQWTTQTILDVAVAAVAVISLILGLIFISVTSRLNRRFARYKAVHSTADLDQVYHDTKEETVRLQTEINQLHEQINELRKRLETKVSTARMIRYNAFSDTGSDLSYSLALLDDHKDGVVLSSIYGRDESRTYGKPILEGQSKYPLTQEEKDLIGN